MTAPQAAPSPPSPRSRRPSRTWGCYVPGRGMSAGGVMRWRVVLELAGADGARQVHEVGAGERPPTGHAAATLGLSLEQGKAILAALQRHLVTAQVDEHCRDRRRCDRCGASRPLKDLRPRRLASLFGVVAVRAPRFDPCRCGIACRRSITPVAEVMPDRCTPEYERAVAAMGAALPYRRALALLGEFFPLGDAPAVETTRQRTLRVGARLERAALAPPQPPPAAAPEAGSIALGIDAGHVRSVRSYQVRSFEAFVAQVGGAEGKQVVFGGVPAEADRQHQQLRGVLHRLGATPGTPVTILSDGAGGPRSLGEAACVGPTSHVLDWFHLAMRIHHVAQAAKGWPADTPGEREGGARLADAVERIRWRLWHGQVRRALDLVGETLTWLEGMGEATPVATSKVTALLRGLETYVSGQAELIIDYAEARRRGEPISTATTESTVQWLLHRRMGAGQQMRWSPRGAHRMLQVRTAVANGTLARDHAAAERWARRPFRPAA
jgi:hypothetical protein